MSAATTSTPAFQLRNPAGLYEPAPNGYSHIAVVERSARNIYIAEAAGASLTDIAKLTVLVVEHTEERLRIFGLRLVLSWL